MRIVPVLSLVMLAACAVPRPLFFKGAMAPPPHAIGDARAQHEAAVRAAIKRYYPRIMHRSDGGVQTVFFVASATGAIQRTDLIRGEPPIGAKPDALLWRFSDLENDPMLRQTGVTEFEPGEVGPDRVVVVWAQRDEPTRTRGPFRFVSGASSQEKSQR